MTVIIEKKPIPKKVYEFFRKKYKKCVICEKRFAKSPRFGRVTLQYLYNRMELHHKKKRSLGGTNDVNNLEAVCGHCHYEIHADEIPKSVFFARRFDTLKKRGDFF